MKVTHIQINNTVSNEVAQSTLNWNENGKRRRKHNRNVCKNSLKEEFE